MRGRLSAVTAATTLALLSLMLPPISFVSSATVALYTLRLGAFEGFFVLACSYLILSIVGVAWLGNLPATLLFGIILWLPIWAIAIILRETRHLTLAIQTAVALGVLGVLAFYMLVDEPALIWKNLLLQRMPEDALKQMMQANTPQLADMQRAVLEIIPHYMTGAAAAGLVCNTVFGLFMARSWQASLYNPGGFNREYLSLATSVKFSLASMMIVMLAWLSSGLVSEIAWNVTVLLFALYVFIGCAVLHQVFAAMKMGRIMVPLFYVVMAISIFMMPVALVPVALVGLSDAWTNLRNKNSNQHTPTGV